MKKKTLKRVWSVFIVNHIYAGTKAWGRKRSLLRAAGWEIGEGTRIVGPVKCSGTVKIGNDCWIGRDFTVYGNGTVIIGDRCDIAPEVVFYTGGHIIGAADRRAGKGESYTIQIGDGCWLGGRTTFTHSLTVGSGSVVAACACVTKYMQENKLIGGVPAKEIRSL